MNINNKSFLKEIFNYYNFDINKYIGYKIISKGHINTTYTLYFDYNNHVKRFLLQEINTKIFPEPIKLMENICKISEHCLKKLKKNNKKNYKNKVLRIYKTKDKQNHVILSDGSVYRIYHYIENSITFETSKNSKVFYEAGKLIGEFHNLLNDFDAFGLYETIKDFHNSKKRYEVFLSTINNNDKISSCKEEIDFFINNKEQAFVVLNLIENKQIPLRVTHNDTKLNNIMFQYGSNKGLCLVDLDTVMKGCICYDYGDFIRSACNNKSEDEINAKSITFLKDLCVTFSMGFLEKLKNITEIEAKNLINGALCMTYECGLRFLTDYLQDNIYFKVSYPTHNLIRCKTQIEMYKQILENKTELESKIYEIYKKNH